MLAMILLILPKLLVTKIMDQNVTTMVFIHGA